MLVMVNENTRKKGSGREREAHLFQEGAGKVQNEPGYLIVRDIRKCSVNNRGVSA